MIELGIVSGLLRNALYQFLLILKGKYKFTAIRLNSDRKSVHLLLFHSSKSRIKTTTTSIVFQVFAFLHYQNSILNWTTTPQQEVIKNGPTKAGNYQQRKGTTPMLHETRTSTYKAQGILLKRTVTLKIHMDLWKGREVGKSKKKTKSRNF